jgi:TolA-binding protein
MNVGIYRRARKSSAILAAVLSISLSGCSALFIHEPPKDLKAGPGLECSSSLWPIVDITWGMAHAAYAIMIVTLAATGNLCGEGYAVGGSWDDCNVKGFFLSVPFFAMAAMHGYSAGVGFSRNSRCREARRAAIETVKIGSGENRYTAPKIKPPEIIPKSKEPVAVEKGHEREPEDLTVPMKFDLPMMEERRERKIREEKLLEEKLLEKEIKQIRDQIQVIEGVEKADLLFRLADRYFQKYKLELEELKEKEKIEYDTWIGMPGKKEEIFSRNRESLKKIWAKAAFDIYRVILKNYKDYHRRDEVLFVFAYSLVETGDSYEGLGTYRQLIKEFPGSRYVPDAYLAIGEYFFNTGEFLNAVKAYEIASKYEGTKASFLAMYKLAWCYLRLSDKPKAREIMKHVASEAKSEKLRGRANRELVTVFAE